MPLKLPKIATGSALTIIFLAAAAMPLAAGPYRPVDDAEVLERLPAYDDVAVRDLADRQAELRNEPDNLALAIEIAASYAELGRKKGDPRYEGYARAALAPWWDLERPPLPVRLLRAHLRQRLHDFDAALEDIDAALVEQPNHPQAWLSKAMIHAVRGEPEQAIRACEKLPDDAVSLMASGCKGHAGRLTGEAKVSYRNLEKAIGEHPEAAPASRVWLMIIMAEIAMQLGEEAEAERHLRDALTLDDQDPYLLGLYADLLLDQGRYNEVIGLLQDHAQIDPLLLRLAIAGKRSGHESAAEHTEQLRLRFEAAALRGDSVHLREQSRFALEVLEHSDDALDLAKRNWATQRERADARLLLEAAIATGRPDAAAPVLDWMQMTDIEDTVLVSLVAGLEGERS